MTILQKKACSTFRGTGGNNFTIDIYYKNPTDLVVKVKKDTDTNFRILAEGIDYLINNPIADPDSGLNRSFVLNLVTAFDNTYTITVERKLSLDQPFNFKKFSAVDPVEVEKALDYQALISQELKCNFSGGTSGGGGGFAPDPSGHPDGKILEVQSNHYTFVDKPNGVPDTTGVIPGKVLTVGASGNLDYKDIPRQVPSPAGQVDHKILETQGGNYVLVDKSTGGGGYAPNPAGQNDGKMLEVQSNAYTFVDKPQGLPTFTSVDANKVPTVNATGTAVTYQPIPKEIPDLSSATDNQILKVQSHALVVGDLPTPPTSLPDTSTANVADHLVLDSSKNPQWVAQTKELPDTATASPTEHLVLDSSKQPQWVAQTKEVPDLSTASDGQILKVQGHALVVGDETKEIPDLSSATDNQILKVQSHALVVGDLPTPPSSLPDTSTATSGDHLVLDATKAPKWVPQTKEVPDLSAATDNQILKVQNHALVVGDLPTPPSSLPDTSTATSGDHLVLDSTKAPKWTAQSKELPDTATANVADHLVLDATKAPKWVAQTKEIPDLTAVPDGNILVVKNNGLITQVPNAPNPTSATAGQVLTANGLGGASYQTPATTDSDQLKLLQSTGVVSGLSVTRNSADVQSVDVSAGKAIFVSDTAGIPGTSTITDLAGITKLTIINSGGQPFTWLTVDKNNTYHQYASNPHKSRGDEVLIACIDHSETTNVINDIYDVGKRTDAVIAQLEEALNYLNPIVKTEITPSGSHSLKNSAGIYYGVGHRGQSADNFHETALTATDPLPFVFRQNNGVTTAPLTTFPALPKIEHTANTLTELSAGNWGLFPVFMMSNGKCVILYSSSEFGTDDEFPPIDEYIELSRDIWNKDTAELGGLVAFIAWHGGKGFIGIGKSYIINHTVSGWNMGGGGSSINIPAPADPADDGKILQAQSGQYQLVDMSTTVTVTADRPTSLLGQKGGRIIQVRSDTHIPLLLNRAFDIKGYRGDWWAEMFSAYKDGATPNTNGDSGGRHFRLRDIVPDMRLGTGGITPFGFTRNVAETDYNTPVGNGNVYTHVYNPGRLLFGTYAEVFTNPSFSFDALQNTTSNPVIIKMANLPSDAPSVGDEGIIYAGIQIQLHPLHSLQLGTNAILNITTKIRKAIAISNSVYLHTGISPVQFNRTSSGGVQPAPVVPGLTLDNAYQIYYPTVGETINNFEVTATTHIVPGILGSDYRYKFQEFGANLATVLNSKPYLPIILSTNSVYKRRENNLVIVQDVELRLDLSGHTAPQDHIRFDLVKLADLNAPSPPAGVTKGSRGAIVPGELLLTLNFIPKTSTFVQGCEFNAHNDDHGDYPTLTIEHGTVKENAHFAGVIDANHATYAVTVTQDDIDNGMIIMRMHGKQGSAGETEVTDNYNIRIGVVNRSLVP